MQADRDGLTPIHDIVLVGDTHVHLRHVARQRHIGLRILIRDDLGQGYAAEKDFGAGRRILRHPVHGCLGHVRSRSGQGQQVAARGNRGQAPVAGTHHARIDVTVSFEDYLVAERARTGEVAGLCIGRPVGGETHTCIDRLGLVGGQRRRRPTGEREREAILPARGALRPDRVFGTAAQPRRQRQGHGAFECICQ